MVPVLLLLLLHGSLANQELFCVNISSYVLQINVGNASISENTTLILKHVGCQTNEVTCTFQCTYSNSTWYNDTDGCRNVSVNSLSNKTETYKYTLNENTICFLYFCTDLSIEPLIKHLKNDSLSQEELEQIYDLKTSCPTVFDTNSEVKKTLIGVEKLLIHKIMNTSQVKVDDSKSYDLRDLYLNVIKPSCSSTGADLLIQTKLVPENDSSVPEVWMPVNALQLVPQEIRTIGLGYYVEHNHFQLAEENITSKVVRIELLGNQRLQNLKPPIKMIFRITSTNIDNGSRLICHYFDEHDFTWKTDGCETQNEENNVICYCNHTTPFAVLMIREPISEVHWKILSYISYIGCGLSAFFTALSLVMYAFTRNHKMDYSICIHVSLSGALFLLNTAFMLTEWGATTELDWVCVFIAAAMHYSLLCCFTWMGIEALHLYLLVIKVFNTYYKHYLLKLSLAGWGIPGVIVATSFGLKFYGKMELEMDGTSDTNKICWITNDTFFYSVNLLYFSLIFVFNSGILMAVASNICKMKQVLNNNLKFKAMTEGKSWRSSDRFGASCKSSMTVLSLTCLMGTTWGLAFLGSGHVNYPILYLFCILNSLQGFFIFLWICLSFKRQRKRDLEEKWTSTPTRISATKSD